MNRREQIVFLVAALMVVGSGLLLAALKKNQQLGKPGVKVVAEPLLDEDGNIVAEYSVYLPSDVSGYLSQAVPMQKTVLDWLPGDTLFAQRYYGATNGFWINMGAVLMGGDRTSIHQPQYCLTGQGYRVESDLRDTIRVGGEAGYDLPIRRIVARGTMRGADDRVVELSRVLVYWFAADGRLTSEHETRMWEQAVEQMKTGVLQRWAYVTCFAPCLPGEEAAAFAKVDAFIAEAAPQFILR